MPTPDLSILEKTLRDLLQERLLDLPEGFTAETNLYEAGLDSMGIMQLLLAIEDRFGVLLPEADVSKKNFCTVSNLSTLLHRHLNKQREAK